ncbi:MAG: hypothetical protein AAF772_11275 [Acidobacteriota bacterium]
MRASDDAPTRCNDAMASTALVFPTAPPSVSPADPTARSPLAATATVAESTAADRPIAIDGPVLLPRRRLSAAARALLATPAPLTRLPIV